VIPLTSDVS